MSRVYNVYIHWFLSLAIPSSTRLCPSESAREWLLPRWSVSGSHRYLTFYLL